VPVVWPTWAIIVSYFNATMVSGFLSNGSSRVQTLTATFAVGVGRGQLIGERTGVVSD